jgi:hypothetical protein
MISPSIKPDSLISNLLSLTGKKGFILLVDEVVKIEDKDLRDQVVNVIGVYKIHLDIQLL